MKRSLLAVAAVATSVLVLGGCASTPAADPSKASGGVVAVVATTNVYGSIAEAVGGDHVTVTSMVASYSQDPHDFQASAKDQLLVKNAGLLIENGGGYDPFLDAIVQATGTKAPRVVAAELSPEYPADGDLQTHKDDADHAHDHLAGFNEHVFYDPAVMAAVADRIAAELGTLDPAHRADFEANAKTFGGEMATLEGRLTELAARSSGKGVFVTEPLPLYLTDAAGLDNKTPGDFSEAVEEGQDVPAATLLEALDLVGSGSVQVVITNAQAAGAETTRIEEKATAANVPVLKFSELVPDGKTYAEWMQANVDELVKALG